MRSRFLRKLEVVEERRKKKSRFYGEGVGKAIKYSELVSHSFFRQAGMNRRAEMAKVSLTKPS